MNGLLIAGALLFGFGTVYGIALVFSSILTKRDPNEP